MNDIEMTVSVIVPCYNGARDLPRCVKSLLAQTIPVEIVIVDDGSTDDTGDVADSFARQSDRVKVVHKARAVLPQARKSGLEVASGELIGFVDSDDWVEPTLYERLRGALVARNADIACASVILNYEDGREREKHQTNGGEALAPRCALERLHCRRAVFQYMWNKLYRRSLFEGVVFPQGNFIGEDYVTVIQLVEKAACIAVVDEPLCHYWQGLSSMSRGVFKPSHRVSYREYQRVSEELAARHPDTAGAIYGYMMVEYMSFVVAMSRNKVYDQAMIREIQAYVRMHLKELLSCRDADIAYKISAILMSIHPRLMTYVYWLVRRKNGKGLYL